MGDMCCMHTCCSCCGMCVRMLCAHAVHACYVSTHGVLYLHACYAWFDTYACMLRCVCKQSYASYACDTNGGGKQESLCVHACMCACIHTRTYACISTCI